jgi:hypothetical protein
MLFYIMSVFPKGLAALSLHDALKSSYGDNKSRKKLASAGYKYDSKLSNRNQQVWFNSNDKKLLVNVAGTHNLKDWGTDAWLAAGHLKDTNRYKEAKKTIDNAKKTYSVHGKIDTTITGHSLGGSIAGYIGNKDDKVYTLDKGATIGQKMRKNEMAFRTSGDIVSAMNANSKRMTTLNNPNLKTGISPIDAYTAHNVNNIKNSNIHV